jgi:uncharacterized RDD family membrane protein YckC
MRIIAAIIDGVILYIPVWILQSFFFSWMMFGELVWYGWMLSPLLLGILEIAYFVVLETMNGTSIGKTVLGYKVTTLDGQKPTMDKALIRNISKIYGLLLLLDFVLGLITPGDPYQKYTDRMAGTRVVRSEPMQIPRPPSYAPPPPQPSVAYCSGCGAPLPSGAAYCPKCGRKVR